MSSGERPAGQQTLDDEEDEASADIFADYAVILRRKALCITAAASLRRKTFFFPLTFLANRKLCSRQPGLIEFVGHQQIFCTHLEQ